MKAEGCDQGICVGRTDMGYWHRVLAGTSMIFSGRNDDKTFATIEVNKYPDFFGNGKPKMVIVQVRGRFNRNVVDPEQIKAIEKFARAMNYDSTVDPWEFRLKFKDNDATAPGLSGFVRAFGRRR